VKPSNLDAAELPRLHGFNEEFSPNGVAQVGDRKTPALIAVGLSVCIIGGLALASSTVNGGLRLTLGSAPTASRNTERDGSGELVDSLLLQVEEFGWIAVNTASRLPLASLMSPRMTSTTCGPQR
jgi:hypothetical protein